MFGESTILDAGNMGESSLISDTVDLSGLKTFKFIVIWENGSGSPVGELTCESSLDGINFETVLESNQSIIDDSGFHIYDFPYNPFVLMRVRYVRTQGSGDMTMLFQYGG